MSLIEEMMVPCIIMNKVKTSDGEGGTVTTWTEGAEIKASIVLENTMEAVVAEKQGVTSTFTITTSKNNELDYHDVIKRVSDGVYFRITSTPADKESPSFSRLDIAQARAEKWELTS